MPGFAVLDLDCAYFEYDGGDCVDADEDGYTASDDCDDTDDSIHPGIAADRCDGEDNDCDGDIDEDALTWVSSCEDHDGDGFGDDTTEDTSCVTMGVGLGDPILVDPCITLGLDDCPATVSVGGDCDDDNSDVYPGNENWYTEPYHCEGYLRFHGSGLGPALALAATSLPSIPGTTTVMVRENGMPVIPNPQVVAIRMWESGSGGSSPSMLGWTAYPTVGKQAICDPCYYWEADGGIWGATYGDGPGIPTPGFSLVTELLMWGDLTRSRAQSGAAFLSVSMCGNPPTVYLIDLDYSVVSGGPMPSFRPDLDVPSPHCLWNTKVPVDTNHRFRCC